MLRFQSEAKSFEKKERLETQNKREVILSDIASLEEQLSKCNSEEDRLALSNDLENQKINLDDLNDRATERILQGMNLFWDHTWEKPNKWYINHRKNKSVMSSVIKLHDCQENGRKNSPKLNANTPSIKGEKNIAEIIFVYYKEKYGTRGPFTELNEILDFINPIIIPKISEIQALALEKPLSEHELFNSLEKKL